MDDLSESRLGELERRMLALETKVAAMPSVADIDTRITEQVKANPPPPVKLPAMPSLQDFTVPLPSYQSLADTARTTWTLFAMFNELKLLFWTLFDRRYHMAWATRLIVGVILLAIVFSHWWLPFAFDNIVGRLWEKTINLLLSFVVFFLLHYEMRRYQEWLSRRA